MTLILGIGNRFRSDDGVGPLVVDQLRALGLAAEEHCGEGAGLIDLWGKHVAAVIVDATRSGAPPGTIRRLDAATARLPTGLFHCSSHLFGLAEAVETARVLGRLPASLVIYGIEGDAWGFGDQVTPRVAEAAEQVVRHIAGELNRTHPVPDAEASGMV